SRRAVLVAALVLAIALPVTALLHRPSPEGPAVGALRKLEAAFNRSPRNEAALRREIVWLRAHYPGTPEALEAARLMMRLYSPFAGLDRKPLPADLPAPGRLPGLVAVFGQAAGSFDSAPVAISPDGWEVAGPNNGNDIHIWDA